MSLSRPRGGTFTWCQRVAPVVAFLLGLIGFGSADRLSAQSAPVVSVSGLNPRLNQDRGGCVRAFATAGAEAECFDLLAAHAAPGIRALGKTYAPTFIYNSATATPHPVIRMNVTVPANAGVPSSVSAVLRVDGSSTATATATWTGSSFTPGQPKRISVGYEAQGVDAGVHPYTLEVTSTYGSVNYSTTVSDTLVIVNRAFGPFGAGWWLAGLESVSLFGSSVLWIGSDGSTHAYRPTGTGFGPWVADNSGGVDSIVFVATPGGGWPAYYARKLRSGGGEVRYGTSGMQIATINRMGDTTRFNWSSASNGYGVRLDSISLPRRADFDTHQGFVFGYPSTSSPPTSVTSPGGRTLSIGTNGWQLTSFTDPDTSTESFGYLSGTYRMAYLVDPRGSRTDFVYHATGHLNGATRYGGGSVRNAADAYTGFWSPDVRGYMGSVPLDTMWAYGIINGPRDDVADAKDETDLWTNGQGAPTRITDALNNTTYIYREDPRFPEAVTKVDAPAAGVPNGYYTTRMVHRAHFTTRGTVDTTTVVNPLGDSLNALTTYDYGDARWPDFASKATSPTGLVSLTGYNAKGLREWQQVGTDTLRRVRFAYDTLGRVVSVRSVRAAAAGEAAETMEYTSPLGNLTAVVSPLGIRTTYQQDALGRDTLVTTPVDSIRSIDGLVTGALRYQSQKTRYDAVGRVRSTVSIGSAVSFPLANSATATPWASVPAESVVVNNVYDPRHDLVAVSRTAWPDSSGIGTVTTGYRYDALGRKVAEIPAMADSTKRDSTVYDAAGNVIASITRRGKTLSFTYDALGRLTHRSVPSETDSTDVKTNVPGALWYFPFFADSAGGTLNGLNRGSATLAIPGEEASFVYDAGGHVTRAVNADAVVARQYYPGGQLKTDTLKIRTYTGVDTTSHVYGLGYTYDLEGRRTQMDLPVNIAPYPGTVYRQTYHYDPTTGALDRIGHTDAGNESEFTYTYDSEGRLSTFSRNGFTEQHYYDADGRDTLRTEVKASTGWQMHRDRTRYDLRGKQIRVATPTDSTINGYSGLGTLARSYHDTYSSSTPDQNESYTQDPLGNQATQRQSSTGGSQFQFDVATPVLRRRYQAGTGRLLVDSTQTADGFTTGIDTTAYDGAGNRIWYYDSHPVSTPYPDSTGSIETSSTSSATYAEWMRSWYAADEKLRFVDRRSCYVFHPDGKPTACNPNKPPMPNERPAFEEYRYDALGRRVLVRSRQHYACGTRCESVVRRIVWDGDQVLAEIQAPGYTGTPAATMEQDVGFKVAAASSVVSDPIDGPSTTSTYYPGYYFGRVLYTLGPDIDRPLSVVRVEYSDSLSYPITIYPHENWNGTFDLGSYGGGSLTAPCKLLQSGLSTPFQVFTPEPGTGGEVKRTATDTTSHCLKVDWPAPHLWLTNRIRENNVVGAESWNGSLIDGMRDATGQMYMRNRYYDPASGRFTQQDPIGLAGGLNMYGFAAGDPVSFDDPYGLCPRKMRQSAEKCQKWNEKRVAQARKIVVLERERGNPFAPAIPAGVQITGEDATEVKRQCNRQGMRTITKTGCSDADDIVLNADRNPSAISQTLVHEITHVDNPGTRKGTEGCAKWQGVWYYQHMLGDRQDEARDDPNMYTSWHGSSHGCR